MDFGSASEILKAIAHPVRLKILKGLLKDECNVGGMVEKLDLPQSTVSQHLSILRSRGIICPRKEGVRTCYSVSDERVKGIIDILS
jgi:ArsR family transcriptional regulator